MSALSFLCLFTAAFAKPQEFVPFRFQTIPSRRPTPFPQPQEGCALRGTFYNADVETLDACVAACSASPSCGGVSFKHPGGTGEPAPVGHGDCTGKVGLPCCYMQASAAVGAQEPRENFACWRKPTPPGKEHYTIGNDTAPFMHFWETGINSPHSAMTLRSDYQKQMTALKKDIGYKYTRCIKSGSASSFSPDRCITI